MQAVIFTGGLLRPGRLVQEALASADMIIAADSGAEVAWSFKVLPAVVIGDFDSLDSRTKGKLESKGVQFIIHDSAKEQTDTELAIAYAVRNHASRITILGGIEGDRIDHILANVFAVIDAKVPVRFISGSTVAWGIHGPTTAAISGNIGDTVSLVPLTARAVGLETSGLRYPLWQDTLHMNQSRGISNVMTRTKASVKLSQGALLVVHHVRSE